MKRSRGLHTPASEVGILVGLMIFAPLIDGGTTHFPVLVIRLLLLAGLALWIIRSFRSGNMIIYREPMFAMLIAFIGLSGLGILHSSYVTVSMQGFVGLFIYAILFFLLLHQLDILASVRILVCTIIAMGLFEGLVGIIQYSWIGEERAKGTFFNPNFFAAYEVVTVLLSLCLLTWTKWEKHGWKKRCLLGSALGISLIGLVMAQSRGAFIAFLVALLFVGFCRSRKLALLLPLAVVICVIALPNPMKQRAVSVSDHDPYAYTRLEIWKNSLHRIQDHPFGTGLGTYKYLSFKYRFPTEGTIVRYEKRAESAHNEYLQMAVELGIAGLALFLCGIGVWIRAVKNSLQGDVSWERGAVIGLSSGVLAILVHAVMDSVFHEPALVVLLIVCGSLVLLLKRLDGSREVRTVSIPFPYHPARAVLVLILVVASAALIIQPAAAWFAYEQGNHAAQSGHSERAWEWYRRAILVDPGTTAYRDAAARMSLTRFYASGEPQWLTQAVEEMAICQKLNPMDGRIPSRLGMLYLMLAERVLSHDQRDDFTTRAMKSYEKAIKADPFSPFNYVELGKLLLSQGRFEDTNALLLTIIAYEPNFLPARHLLSKIATQTGNQELAHLQYAAIESIQKRYKDRKVSSLESRFLDVNLGRTDQR